MKTIAIITAAGLGKRMGRRKQFIRLAGKPLLWWTLSAFEKARSIDGIVLVVNADEITLAKKLKFKKIIQIVAGGKERQDSVYNGLKALPDECEIVAIHDGARPLVTVGIIDQAVEQARQCGAIVVGVRVKDTLKQMTNAECRMTNEGRTILKTIDRKYLWQAQTPQVFKKEIILKAYKQGYNKCQVTDDSMLVEKLGLPVKLLMGSYQNLKVTTSEDLNIAEVLLKGRKI